MPDDETQHDALKRDFDPGTGGGIDRDKLADSDFIDTEGRRFPIVKPGDVSDAVAAFGRAKPPLDYDTFRRRLIAICRRKGEAFVNALPNGWEVEPDSKSLDEDLNALEAAVKAGARNSTTDLTRLQQIHDLAVANGAQCAKPDEVAELPMLKADDGLRVALSTNDDLLVALSTEVKALGDGKVGGYLVVFGSAEQPDRSPRRDFFTADTDYDLADDGTGKSTVYYHHGQDAALGKQKLGTGDLRKDDVGVWVEAQLKLRNAYERAVYELATKGKLGWSSGSVPHLVERVAQANGTHQITRWPLGLDASLTPIPAEPRTRVVALKDYLSEAADYVSAWTFEATSDSSSAPAEATAEATSVAPLAPTEVKAVEIAPTNTLHDGEIDMTDEELKALMEGAAKAGALAAIEALKQEPPTNSAGYATKTPAETKTHEPLYHAFGAFLLDVAKSAQGPVNRQMEELKSADPLDENGYDLARAMGPQFVSSIYEQKAPYGANEALDSAGGFLVGTDRNNSIMARVYDSGQLLRAVDTIPISAASNSLTLNAEDETSRADGYRRGGVRAYWAAEAGTMTASAPKFRQMELKLKKAVGLVYATEEMLADTPALAAYILNALPDELRFVVEDSIINGSGAGMPLGVLASGALISVTKETGQAAATVVGANVKKMFARMWARSLGSASWYISQDVWPQLFELSQPVGTGGSAIFLPPGGLSAAPYGTLMGRPIVPNEYCPAVGTVGDIVFADLGEYQMIDKGGIQSASSIHVRFINGDTCYRFVYRVDGQPKWNSTLTPKNAGATVSPFVALATRA